MKKINALSTNNASVKYHKNVLQQREPLNNSNDIHNEFVATQIDKANGIYAYICLVCYGLNLIKELGLDQNTNSIN